MEANGGSKFNEELLAHVPFLKRYAFNLCRNTPEAEDLIQSTLLKALRYQAKFTPGTNIKAWLATIMRNHFLQYRKRGNREVLDGDGLYASELTVPAVQEYAFDYQAFAAAFKKLSRAQEQAIILTADGLTPPEIAHKLGIPEGTVKSRVHRARVILSPLLRGVAWAGHHLEPQKQE